MERAYVDQIVRTLSKTLNYILEELKKISNNLDKSK